MSAMFLAMVWHARRRQQAAQDVERIAESRAQLLERQERFLHDVIARAADAGHDRARSSRAARLEQPASPELAIALDELGRIERIIDRLLLLAKAERPDFLDEARDRRRDVRRGRLPPLVGGRRARLAARAGRRTGTLARRREALRIALDALLENAVKHTEPHEAIELRARRRGRAHCHRGGRRGLRDPADALERIFDRFARVGRRSQPRRRRRRARPRDRRRDRPRPRRAGRGSPRALRLALHALRRRGSRRSQALARSTSAGGAAHALGGRLALGASDGYVPAETAS